MQKEGVRKSSRKIKFGHPPKRECKTKSKNKPGSGNRKPEASGAQRLSVTLVVH